MTKILYIEDNEDNVFMLKSRLERRNFEVVTAADGAHGYETALQEKPDVILLDVGLPDMDGYETARKIKANAEINAIPIIILTAHVMNEDKNKALAAGAQDYEVKPIHFNDLLEKIVRWTSKT